MKFTSLDTITRSVLQQRQLPIHYYLQYLKFASDCFRELHFDTLRVVNEVVLPVGDDGFVPFPCDYVDYVKIGLPLGQMVKPLHQATGLSGLEDTSPALPVFGDPLFDESLHTNDNGEVIGRYYSYSDDLLQDTYKVVKSRGGIQLNKALAVQEIYLSYISDGTYCDAATKVDPLAQEAIETYQKWKCSRNADNWQSPEGQLHKTAIKRLRARLSGLTLDDIKRSLYAATKPTLK